MEEKKECEKPKLFNVRELSAYLSLPPSTIFTWTSMGRIPGVVRLGRALRFDRAEIDRWIESKKSAAQSRTGE